MPTPDALLRSYGREYDQIRRELRLATNRLWRQFGGPTEQNMEQWLGAILPTVAGAERATVRLVSLYLDALSSEWGITASPRIDPDQVLGARLRAGTPPIEVYKRPVITTRAQLASGKSLAESIRIGGTRAVATADTDVMLAHRVSAGDAFEALGFEYFRRVPTGKSCDLCLAASTQRYRTGNLMPIHGHCDCRVMPIYEREDPGQVINRELLAQRNVRDAIDDRSRRRSARSRSAAEDLPDSNIDAGRRFLESIGAPDRLVREHGELGPMLVDPRHSFTGPDDLAG